MQTRPDLHMEIAGANGWISSVNSFHPVMSVASALESSSLLEGTVKPSVMFLRQGRQSSQGYYLKYY